MAVQVSIIIVNFNCGQYVFNCIESILKYTQTVEFEIILIDNGSMDGSVHEIRVKFPEIRIVTNSHNIGFGAANNVGARFASGEYLFFLNPDTLLLDDCISQLYQFLLQSSRNIAGLGCKLVKPDGDSTTSFGNFPTLFQQFSDIGFRVFYNDYYNNRLSLSPPVNFNTPHKVDYISGADIMIKKGIFQELGGFDEQYFMYFEDADLFFRLRKGGYEAWLLPGVKILHYGSITTQPEDSYNYSKYALMEKSKYIYFARNRGHRSIFIVKMFQLTYLIFHSFGRHRYSLRKTIGITIKA